MKKYSMLCGGILIILVNIFGIIIGSVFGPTCIVMIAISLLSIALVSYIQISKRRILLETAQKQSYVLFGIIILFQIYFTIIPFALLIYLSDLNLLKTTKDTKLQSFIAGNTSLPSDKIQSYNFPYYFSNFGLFMYYLRCYYVMFWRQNIVFIYRYLKTKVNQLNQTLLSSLPKIQYNIELTGSICSLCLEEYREEQRITRLHCKHIYHLDCVKVWVMRSNCCPLCRKRVVF